jgi:ABC-2 type transport system permease protein
MGLTLTALLRTAGNPISHVATAARDLMNDTGGAGGSVAWALVATAAITLVSAPLTLHLYGRQG